MRRLALAVCAIFALTAAAARTPQVVHAIASLQLGAGPYLPGSRIAPTPTGIRGPFSLVVKGPGTISDNTFIAPDVAALTQVTLIGGNASAIAVSDILIAPAPALRRPLLAVAAYDEGVILYDPTTFERLGEVATGGAPSDVTFARDGSFAATNTSGDTIATVSRDPWHVDTISGVPFGNEIAIAGNGSVFVSNRSAGDSGAGALSRVLPSGMVSRIETGDTAEGLAVDEKRDIVYVGNVNDGTVLPVEMHSMKPLQRIHAVPRVFGIALNAAGTTLYTVANQSAASQFRAAGYVAAIDVRGGRSRTVARSSDLHFPVGVALDDRRHVFVTDEADDQIYVLDATTLRAMHAPLATCRTPWKPFYDAMEHRLFVPCARADAFDVFDTTTLRRIARVKTGGYPLAISLWRPSAPAER